MSTLSILLWLGFIAGTMTSAVGGARCRKLSSILLLATGVVAAGAFAAEAIRGRICPALILAAGACTACALFLLPGLQVAAGTGGSGKASSGRVQYRVAALHTIFSVSSDIGAAVRIPGLVRSIGTCLSNLFPVERAEIVFLDRMEHEPTPFRVYDALSGKLLLKPKKKGGNTLDPGSPGAAAKHPVYEPLKTLNDLKEHLVPSRLLEARESGDTLPEAIIPLITERGVEAAIFLWGIGRGTESSAFSNLTRAEKSAALSLLSSQFSMTLNRVLLHMEVGRLSRHDGLTGVYRRRFFLSRAREEVRRSLHSNIPLSFLMLDIDHFKTYNDTYGHLVGDQVLRHVAGFMRSNVRGPDIVCRYGGEEFAVLLVDTASSGAVVVAERIREAIEQFRFKAGEKETGVTVSCGVVEVSAECTSVDDVIARADEALYRAKREGRNRVCVFGEGSNGQG